MSTQLPWSVITTEFQKPGYPYAIVHFNDLPSGNEVVSAHVASKEDAEFIVEACNRHQKLLDGIEKIQMNTAVHYLGQAFEPEHMRMIGNFCIGLLNGEEDPSDIADGPLPVIVQEMSGEILMLKRAIKGMLEAHEAYRRVDFPSASRLDDIQMAEDRARILISGDNQIPCTCDHGSMGGPDPHCPRCSK